MLAALTPIEMVFLSTAGVGAASLSLLVWTRRSSRRQAADQLRQYKEAVVAYSDARDRLKERHKMLPFADPDFVAPMVGETLAVYQAVEQTLGRHRDQWMEMMDVWEMSQKHLEDGESQQAQDLLDARKVSDITANLQQECEHELDRLENAHQRVDQRLEANRQANSEVVEQIDATANQGLPADPYQEPLAEVNRRTTESQQLRSADPLSAELAVSQATLMLQSLAERLTRVLRQKTRADAIESGLQELRDLVARHRAEGLKLVDAQGDPDPLLQQAADSHDAAYRVLEQADDEAASRQLDHAATLIDEAEEAVVFQARFREEGSGQLQELEDAVRTLTNQAQGAQRQTEELEQRHAAAAWRMVDLHAQQARELAEGMDRLLAEAANAMSFERQQYYRAHDLLDEVQRQLPEAQRLTGGVEQHLRELDGLAETCQRKLTQLDDERRRLDGLLQSNTADRDRSNHRHQQAASALDELIDEARRLPPDWRQIEGGLQNVEKDLQMVARMVEEDLHLAQQAESEIREAAHELRRCQGFYQSGVSANSGRAEGDLRSAEDALARQDYERAIQLANAAETSARRATEQARRDAQHRERESQRRRTQDAASQMATALAVAAETVALFGRRRRRW